MWLRRNAVIFLIVNLLLWRVPATHAATDSCVSAPDGLVAWWTGDDLSRDVNPTGVPTQINTAPAAGKVGEALTFDSGSAMRVLGGKRLNVGEGPGFSAELWIYPRDVVEGHPLLDWNTATTWGTHLWIYGAPGQLLVNVVDTVGVHHHLSSGPGIIKANQWQHVAVTYDKNGNACLYRNGVLMAQQDIGSFSPQTSSDLNIGLRPAGIGQGSFFKGMMDEISLYNRALSGQEIEAIFKAGSAGKCAHARKTGK